LQQRSVKIEIIAEEMKFSVWYKHKKNNFPTQSTLDGVVVSDFCCDNGSPDGRDVQAGLTDRMVYQRHVSGFLVFPAGGVRYNLQIQYQAHPEYRSKALPLYQPAL
jgi:hypothetical protein